MENNFTKMGLLDKAKVLERAKALASDKANMLKQTIKEASSTSDE